MRQRRRGGDSAGAIPAAGDAQTQTTNAGRGQDDGSPLLKLVLLFAGCTAVKLLLIPAYRSTDFEVHRNWLAITHSLPLSQWYTEDTSQWTLDYPPFFAWFEYVLSQAAQLFDPEMLVVGNLEYASAATVLFQRLSVMAADVLLLLAVVAAVRSPASPVSSSDDSLVVGGLTLANIGLFIVDHVHFQYNGMLYGVLLLAMTYISRRQRYLAGAFLFAALLNLKHIFLYVAPAFFVYLLRRCCFTADMSFRPLHFVLLGGVVAGTFALSFGPFVLLGQLGQVLSRLFPFKRGLCHAYWAANFWALYNSADKVVGLAAARAGLIDPPAAVASMTGGLVTDAQGHSVFWDVPPIATGLLALLAMLVATPAMFVRAVTLCSYASFLFGWHVHEKAVMMMTIPMGLVALESADDAHAYLLLSAAGNLALFPLLFEPREQPLVACGYVAYTWWAFAALRARFGRQLRFGVLETLYLGGLAAVYAFYAFGHRLVFGERLEFLPLMLLSTYTALGVVYSWLLLLAKTLRDSSA